LRITSEYGTIFPRSDGWLTCPRCNRNRHFLRVLPGTSATELPVYCRDCKTEIILHIEQEAGALNAGAHD
jgi:hypothetical protein